MSLSSVMNRILDSKLSFVAATFIGTAIGIWLPAWGEPLGVLGEIFLNILQLCLLPIIITSISLSIAHFMLMKSNLSSTRIILVLFLAITACSFLGSGAAYLTEPGKNLDFTSSESLSELITKAAHEAKGLNDPIESKLGSGVLHLLIESIPKNIFESLSGNKFLQVVIFSIILGIGLGKFFTADSQLVLITRQIKKLFYELFEWFLRFFPFALLCLLAKEVSVAGLDPIIAMGGFISKFYMLAAFIFFVTFLIIKINTKATWRETLSIMFEPLLIAVVTQNSNNTIPPSVIAMRRFNYNMDLVQLLIPIGAIICRFGFIIYFGYCVVFALEVYGIDLTLSQYALVCLVIGLAGLASAGQEEITINLASMLLILNPIGIPLEGVLPLLFAIDLFMDPLRTALTVQLNCAAVSAMDKPRGRVLTREEVEQTDLSSISSHAHPRPAGQAITD